MLLTGQVFWKLDVYSCLMHSRTEGATHTCVKVRSLLYAKCVDSGLGSEEIDSRRHVLLFTRTGPKEYES